MFILTKWVNIGKYNNYSDKSEDIVGKVANQYLYDKQQYDKMISLSQEIRCFEIYCDFEKPTKISKVSQICLPNQNSGQLSNCLIDQLYSLTATKSSEEEVAKVISKINSIDSIILSKLKIDNLNLSKTKAKSVFLNQVEIEGELVLPPFVKYLSVTDCTMLENIKIDKLTKIHFGSDQNLTDSELKWLKNIKSLKEVGFVPCLDNFVDYLPSSIIKLETFRPNGFKEINPNRLKLPNLRFACGEIPVKLCEALNLREIEPTFAGNEGVLEIRPRRINVTSSNWKEINKHPEIFEKAEFVYVLNKGFNFDLIPNKLKKLMIFEFSKKSMLISRF